jgi:hypothetical protein
MQVWSRRRGWSGVCFKRTATQTKSPCTPSTHTHTTPTTRERECADGQGRGVRSHAREEEEEEEEEEGWMLTARLPVIKSFWCSSAGEFAQETIKKERWKVVSPGITCLLPTMSTHPRTASFTHQCTRVAVEQRGMEAYVYNGDGAEM